LLENEARAEIYWWQGSEADNFAWQKFNFGMYQILSKKLVNDGFPKPEAVSAIDLCFGSISKLIH
jgi:hypothetical protein